MKSLLCVLLLTAGISQSFAGSDQPKDPIADLVSNLPKAFGGMVAKDAKSLDEFASATAIMAFYALGSAVYQGNKDTFTKILLKDYLQFTFVTKASILIYTALVKDREKTAKAVAEFYKRYSRRYYDSFPKESKNKTVPVPQLAS